MAMPEIIGKGWILSKLDKVSRKPDTLATVLQRLGNDNDSLVEIFATTEVEGLRVLDDRARYRFRRSGELTEKQHIAQHWFQNWWTNDQPIEPILRRGLKEAFATCQEKGIPLDSYWICVSPQFKIAVARTNVQVTLVILTPPPEDVIIELHTENDPISLVKREPDNSIAYIPLKMIRKYA